MLYVNRKGAARGSKYCACAVAAHPEAASDLEVDEATRKPVVVRPAMYMPGRPAPVRGTAWASSMFVPGTMARMP